MDLRSYTPDSMIITEGWIVKGKEYSSQNPPSISFSYGSSERQSFDLYLPKKQKRGEAFPAVVFIHGGYWKSFEKADFSFLAEAFLKQGIAFVSIDYDLAPNVSIDVIVAQVRKALACFLDHAKNWQLDPDRLLLSGHSAGGHLALMTLLHDWSSHGYSAIPFKSVLSLSGLYDLEAARLCLHRDILCITAEIVESCSPLRQLQPNATPLFCLVGEGEPQEFKLQQQELAAAWAGLGNSGVFQQVEGHNHFTILDLFKELSSPQLQGLISQL
ncbi:alpha/beta hydrolase [Kiloniella laminariae]|uniref:Alpha/beta hydrolase n=1 Tax=Kiloniella laminariae TaxID=454162 RepID=A0ABT4LJ85_9PROT|nr:alpha/beta hydrolase [Kiloniella laminariae]MCZ4281158.1 alpha/beta hydrolase [Kiloniella laminariae]